MKAVGLISDEEFEDMDQAVKAKMKSAMAYSDASPEADPAELETDVFAPSVFTVKDVENEAALREKVRARHVYEGNLLCGCNC